MLASEWEVNGKTDEKPGEETQPREQGQAGHQDKTAEDREHGEQRHHGTAEGAGTVRLFPAQHDDRGGDQHEGEERTDVGEFGKGIDVPKAGGDATHLTLVGGDRHRDSHSQVIEGSLSSWMNIHDAHPITYRSTQDHYFENDLTNALIDVRFIALSTAKLMVLAGAGATIWGHGGTPGVQVQGGPDVGFYFRDLKLRMDIQGGYGSDNEYGIVAFSRFRLGRLTVQAGWTTIGESTRTVVQHP